MSELHNTNNELNEVKKTVKMDTNDILKENDELRLRLNQVDEIIKKLQNQVNNLVAENNQLKSAKSNETEIYSTDSEELERETGETREYDWIVNSKKKKKQSKRAKLDSNKRKAESSPEVVTGSTFAPASKLSEAAKPKPIPVGTAQQKENPPPPINIAGIDDYGKIKEIMVNFQCDYKIVSLNNNIWKINMPDSNSYRELSTVLNNKGHEWYTYENKNVRPIKVMVRGLHNSCQKDDIIEDLQKKNLKIIDAVNIIKKEYKKNEKGEKIFSEKKLPLFMLTFENCEKIENVFNITGILNMRVRIEPLKKTTGIIAQCKKCQAYNHTQNFCNRKSRCVKCAGAHDTSNCEMARETPAKCVNCLGDHPANYRGCEVARQLQKIRDQTTRPKENERTQNSKLTVNEKINKIKLRSSKVQENVSFAQQIQPSTSRQVVEPAANMGVNIAEKALTLMQTTLDKICERLDKIEENIQQLNNSKEKQEALNKRVIDAVNGHNAIFDTYDKRFTNFTTVLNQKKNK